MVSMIFVCVLINYGLMWKPLYFRTVPKRNIYSDVKAKLLTEEFVKRFYVHTQSSLKRNKIMFILRFVGIWSSLDTVKRFEHVSAV